MSEISEKQIKRLRSLLTEAETNLSAAKELLTSITMCCLVRGPWGAKSV